MTAWPKKKKPTADNPETMEKLFANIYGSLV
jgi:hypothetical protein